MAASARQEAAFHVYIELGAHRSLKDLHSELRADPSRAGLKRVPSLRTLESWSSAFGWQERVLDVERKAREASEQQLAEWIQQHRERLRQEGLLLQQKGVEWIKEKVDEEVSAHAAIRAIDAGFKLEALALGQVTARIAIEEEDERLKGLTDDELGELIQQVRTHRAKGSEGTGEEKS